MFGLGMGELLVLAVLGLILIGPEQLPELARTIGRFINDLKRTTDGLTEDLKKQAKVDLDLDFMNPLKNQHKPPSQEELNKLLQPPSENVVSHAPEKLSFLNEHNPQGKKMTHNEFGEIIPEANETASTADPTTNVASAEQLSLFPESTNNKETKS